LGSKSQLAKKIQFPFNRGTNANDSNFFRVENYSATEFSSGKKLDLVKVKVIRDDNKKNGRYLNSGVPFTNEEGSALKRMLDNGASNEELVQYFQRPLVTIKRFRSKI